LRAISKILKTAFKREATLPLFLREYLSELKFGGRKTALQRRNKSVRIELLPFLTQYHLALPRLKRILMGKWHLEKPATTARNLKEACLHILSQEKIS